MPPKLKLRSKGEAFTLIELLVVIAIIAILAGISFPAIQGAMGSGKKARTRNDVNQLATAVKAFQLEYGRLPITNSTTSDTMNAANSSVLPALIGANSRGIVFFEAKQAKGGKGGLVASTGEYVDPWGTAYKFCLDTDYDNKLITNGTNYTTVIVDSAGPDRDWGTTNDNISNIK